VSGSTISGAVIFFSARALSRYASTAFMMLSVPPPPSTPQALCAGLCCFTASPCSMSSVIATISLSNRFMLGQMSRCSAFTWLNGANA
jgi:hypothetical protein